MSETTAIKGHSIEAALRRMIKLSPQIAGFVPVTHRSYDPVENAIHSPWPKGPYASEDWRVLPPELQLDAPSPILIFEHLRPPQLAPEQAENFLSAWDAATDALSAKAFDQIFMGYSQSTSFANHILRGRNALRFSTGCRQLLAHFPEIPRDLAGVQAGVLRAQYLGGYVPFRLFPSLVWLDQVNIGKQSVWRVFRQPVTRNGYPIGVCQTYPVDPATEAKWISAA